MGAISPTTVERVRHQQVHGPDEVLVDQPARFGIAFAFLTNRAIPGPTPHTRLWRLLSAVATAL